MVPVKQDYIVIGGGLAGAFAIEGIRERDPEGSILLIGEEKHLPYDRPPLSKKLWLGTQSLDEIQLHDRDYYEKKGTALDLGTKALSLDPAERRITTDRGTQYSYGKLLLATGGTPRHLPVPGGDLHGIYYYRYLNDFISLRDEAKPGKRALVIGGGFIGSEMAAALSSSGLSVTLLFPEEYLCSRVFSPELGIAMNRKFMEKGVNVRSGDVPVAIEQRGTVYTIRTGKGESIESDIVVVGAGISPSDTIAREAGLATENGILVDERLRTSDPFIFAAGDIARFPYRELDRTMRIEHWDNSISQGKLAGRNMAGAEESYTHMPFFFSDLFEFGYEAVGDVSSELEIIADWQVENETGVLYYRKEGRIRGVMLCNVWERIEEARELIRSRKSFAANELHGLIKG